MVPPTTIPHLLQTGLRLCPSLPRTLCFCPCPGAQLRPRRRGGGAGLRGDTRRDPGAAGASARLVMTGSEGLGGEVGGEAQRCPRGEMVRGLVPRMRRTLQLCQSLCPENKLATWEPCNSCSTLGPTTPLASETAPLPQHLRPPCCLLPSSPQRRPRMRIPLTIVPLSTIPTSSRSCT